jgi:methylenetetrahydrofolate reductase (NADPH)
MSLADSFAAGAFTVALEITPPKSSLPQVLQRRARLLGDAPGAINVIQRPGRQSSLEAAIELREAGIEPVWHLVTRGKSRAQLDAELAVARDAGIHNILCIRGDHDTMATDEITIREACEAAAAHTRAVVGATLNQYVPDRAAVLKNLLPKLRAGARYVQTQPVFDLDSLRPAAEGVLDASPETKVVAMAMPLASLDAAERIERRLGVSLPASFHALLESGDPEAPWRAFTEVLHGLVESPLVSGVALMTFEMDATPDTGARMLAALRESGAIENRGIGETATR